MAKPMCRNHPMSTYRIDLSRTSRSTICTPSETISILRPPFWWTHLFRSSARPPSSSQKSFGRGSACPEPLFCHKGDVLCFSRGTTTGGRLTGFVRQKRKQFLSGLPRCCNARVEVKFAGALRSPSSCMHALRENNATLALVERGSPRPTDWHGHPF